MYCVCVAAATVEDGGIDIVVLGILLERRCAVQPNRRCSRLNMLAHPASHSEKISPDKGLRCFHTTLIHG
jgi:hypothetical protein